MDLVNPAVDRWLAGRAALADPVLQEMEALAAVSVAALTIYDMAKAIDKGMVMSDVTLVEKTKEAV